MVSLEDIHNCDKCKGKIVLISIDKLGVTRCGYCNEVVNYKLYYDNIYKDEFIKFINTNQKEETKWLNLKNKKRRKGKQKAIL